MSNLRTDYDSPWKEVLERFFPDFMAFFFPQANAEIDWSKPHEFLDKELQQVVRDAETGRHTVDKLIKVWRKDGAEAWVLIHIEVQNQVDLDFPGRIYVYNYRLYDRYKRQIVSLAVLGDDDADWRPESYSYELWGCEIRLRFPIVKLLDYAEQWSALEQSLNPFAVVVMAQVKAQATRRQFTHRLRWKIELVKGLYTRGYSRVQIFELFRFIDWVMALPTALEQGFKKTIHEYEEAQQMRYVTSVERLALQEGIEQGIEQGILQNARDNVLEVLRLRFQDVAPSLLHLIGELRDPILLKALLRQAIMASSLVEFQTMLTTLGKNAEPGATSSDRVSN